MIWETILIIYLNDLYDNNMWSHNAINNYYRIIITGMQDCANSKQTPDCLQDNVLLCKTSNYQYHTIEKAGKEHN